jgi:hypothetical protein
MLFFANKGSGIENMATAFTMPGGLLLMAWMIKFTIKLFKLGKSQVGADLQLTAAIS